MARLQEMRPAFARASELLLRQSELLHLQRCGRIALIPSLHEFLRSYWTLSLDIIGYSLDLSGYIGFHWLFLSYMLLLLQYLLLLQCTSLSV